MSLYTIKPWFVRRLRRFEDLCVARGVGADALTRAAVVISVLTGTSIALGGALHKPAVWFAVPPLVLLRLALNALDGSVARRTGTARPMGTVLNEVGDRLSDAATIGSTAFVVPSALAAGATGAAFLASSVGVLAFALTGTRDCGGPMGKADRAAVLALAAGTGAVLGSATPFKVAAWVLLAGSLVTAAARVRRLAARTRLLEVSL
jgi:CDP-diacylglycerol---glycerol-3-phosphate 3-phosphatidyltransferase